MDDSPIRIHSAAELDALVGEYIIGEEPEIHWEDAHGMFQFASEMEAMRALKDPYFQRFLPEVNWAATVVHEVRTFRRYCAEPELIWHVVQKISADKGAMMLWREVGKWYAVFGFHAAGESRYANVAICLAALQAYGLVLDVDHERVEFQISHFRPRAEVLPT